LKKQYHKLAKKFHPDLVQAASESHKKKAEEHFKAFNLAYERLLVYVADRDAMLEKNLRSGAL
jgi:DnaJ-domain-containing protein 1